MKRLANGVPGDWSDLTENSGRELKVVFLGDGEAGKSSIIARLLLDGENTLEFPGVSTPGIKISHKIYNTDDREIQVHFWDFGGQEILHSMHRLFLTKRALYVVVLNVREDTQDERARYWLYNLHSYAAGAPVLLVLNKMDMNRNASVNEHDLRDLYPSLMEIVKLSARDDSKEAFEANMIAALRRQIGAFQYPPLPLSWSRLRVELQSMECSYIRSEAYHALCDKCGIVENDDVRRELLIWFCDMGISFCCGGSMRLEDYVVLKPEWITNAISAILWNGREDVQNGVISHESIYQILNKPECHPFTAYPESHYKPNEVDYVLQVMRKFHLSFWVNEEMEFIPALCRYEAPAIIYDYAYDPGVLEFRIHYDYLPLNVLHRLMVELRSDLDPDQSWRTGARFVSGTLGVSAVIFTEWDMIRILVRSRKTAYAARKYLQTIRETLSWITKQMGLITTRNEVIYKADGNVEAFDYDMLNMMLDEGLTTTYSRKFRKRISIIDVLGQTDRAERDEKTQLLQDTISACIKMQDNRLYWDACEDDRNAYLRDWLTARGYIVRDQVRTGVSALGRYACEMDLEIHREPGIPWAVCYGLTLRGSGRSQQIYWEESLRRLVRSYDTNVMLGFLVCYVQCHGAQFREIFQGCLDRLSSGEGQGGLLRCTSVEEELPEGIRAVQCIYDMNGFPYEVYQIYVHMYG